MKHKLQQGFLLPAAIFLLVILSGLGAYALNITSLQQVSSTQDVQGVRAYQAARAGLEWGAYQVLSTGAAALENCPASPSSLVIDSFNVSISCTKYTNYYEQGTDHTIAMYDITATASFGAVGTLAYVERQMQVTLSKCLGTDAPTPYLCG
jgi:MSHA biogenesis protein MshP